MIYITGDTHRQFKRIDWFCGYTGTTKKDVMIILGDAGINYYGDLRDWQEKELLSNVPVTFFCVHGNHEMRPDDILSYTLMDWHGGKVWVEYDHPNILFAKDGEIYDLNGQKAIVIGGAYSVDKLLRQEMGNYWFSDEQPSPEIKAYVEQQLDAVDWDVDLVLSHTAPYKYQPFDTFPSYINQLEVDHSTEEWLGYIEEKLNYKRWYAGHFHIDRVTDRIHLMYEKIDTL